MDQVESLVRAWQEGKVCLHPSDTIPGLSFNPKDERARLALFNLKKRDEGKTCNNLIGSLHIAKKFWQPLPGIWDQVLARLWPGPLSVVWKSCDINEFTRDDGTLSLRVPDFSEAASWMNMVLIRLNCPFPSTSVNLSGEPPAFTWDEAVAFTRGIDEHFIPEWSGSSSISFESNPSTIIEIYSDGSFGMLRPGAVTNEMIKAEITRAQTA